MTDSPINSSSPDSAGGKPDTLIQKARRVAAIARAAAPAVDREARFPHEALAALRAEQLLSCAFPAELGGLGCSFSDLAAVCSVLGRACGSTGMIFAMHQMQAGCILRHYGNNDFFPGYLRDAARHQWLFASATSEVGVGGDLRSSITALEIADAQFTVRKACTTLSYGEHTDAILITARRDPAAAAGDQSLAVIRKEDYTLEKTGAWDVLGMRGTCSPPFNVSARASARQILPDTFRDIAIRTMIPWSHLLWSSVWLGIAADAVGTAQSLVKQSARKNPKAAPLGSAGLVEALNLYHQMRSNVRSAVSEYERFTTTGADAELSKSAYGLRINNLKLSSSRLVVDICLQTLAVCGLAGYANNSPFSLGRQLRDSLSAQLMISNNRLRHTNAGLLLITGNDALEDF